MAALAANNTIVWRKSGLRLSQFFAGLIIMKFQKLQSQIVCLHASLMDHPHIRAEKRYRPHVA